jgi:excisionase family DNA binding protein
MTDQPVNQEAFMRSVICRTRSVRETAALLGVHPLTVRQAIARGELRALRLGRRVLVPESELQRLLGPGACGNADVGDGGAR